MLANATPVKRQAAPAVAGQKKRLRGRRSRFSAERFSSAANRYRPRRNRSRPKRPIKANVPTRTAIIPEDMAGAGDGPHAT
jgi:hypothetical protein